MGTRPGAVWSGFWAFAWKLGLGAAFGFLGAGLLFLTTSQPRGEPVLLHPPPTAAPVLVHVRGAVQNPGVYSLPHMSRVKDALEAAGGTLPEADAQALNQASVLTDGQQLTIPWKNPSPLSPVEGDGTNGKTAEPYERSQAITISGLLNINTASQAELENLPGIGEVTAGKIIAYRNENGPFATVADLEKVSGIGPALMEKIEGLVTVE